MNSSIRGSSSAGGSSSISGSSTKPVTISSDEVELYDRQIRVWGLEAQNRLRNSDILIYGLTSLGAEVTKNLVLCGVRSVKLMDSADVTDADVKSQFFLSSAELGTNRAESSQSKAQELNPMVKVEASAGAILEQNEAFFKQFDLVILVDQKHEANMQTNGICRKHSIRFQACGVFGWTGYAFFDFNGFEFLVKKPPKPSATVETTLDVDLMDVDGPSHSKSLPVAIECLDISEEPEDLVERKKVHFASYSDALNINWGLMKKYTRAMKRAVPQSYFPIKALLEYWNKEEATELDVEKLTALWHAEIKRCNQDDFVKPEKFMFFSNPQLIPACAVVGGLVGQESIKALSQNDCPLQNLFIYSALDSTSFVCDFPPRR
ncbi:hypothetical protein L596_028172 [Steinernema carpocapsae]|uniref:THIF-type NAD/FAD binding fold domain-containing protein n=1 Tax=Steinernema carpocapsae TaxID=34508 RepID=A0A4U5LXP7_STECR|nr:hypothetical protein L596_028172 [Steinernema carpocapsae]